MKICSLAINFPVTTTMLFLMVILFGAVSFVRLPIDLMPDVTYPSITIRTDYEHVGPQEIEQLITRPIEETVGSVQGVEKIRSTSSEGQSSVRVSFVWGTDLDTAANDVRDRVDRIRGRLPEESETPAIYKFDVTTFPILYLGVSGALDPVEMRDLVEHQIKYRIERAPGVAAVDVRGGLQREIHVDLDREKLTALDLSLDTVLEALRSRNLNLPAGTVEDGNLDVLVRTKGEFETLDEIRNTFVHVRNGVPILVKDIATVEDSYEEITHIVRLNGVPGLRMNINKQSGSNTVQVVDAVLKEVERINVDLPQVKVFPTMNTSDYIKRAIKNVSDSTLYGATLAAVVLYLFLHSLRTTVVIGLAIPISIMATFGLMYFCGYTLNIMTFGGLALGVGMLVDNAIVVLENIFRYTEKGVSPREASELGSSEVSMAITASTLTTLVVFLPVVFIRGISAVTFKQMAAVVSFALFCSLVVALTLIPLMGSRFLRTLGRPADKTGGGKLMAFVEREYGLLLCTALRVRKSVLFLALALFVVSLWLIRYVGVEFMPQADESEVRVNGEMAVGTRLEVLDATFAKIEQIVREAVPEATVIYSRIGGGGSMGSGGHTGEVRITLVPVSQRTRSSSEVAQALRPLLAKIPGTIIRVREGQGLFLMRMVSGGEEEAEVLVRGYDLDNARDLALRVKREMEQVEGITDVLISREEGQPEEVVRIDRAKASTLGLSVSKIARDIQTCLSGTNATMFRESGDEYEILVRLKETDRLSAQDVLNMTVTSESGRSIVLKNVIRLERREGPVRIEREDQQRIISVAGNIAGRDLVSVMKEVQARVANIPKPQDFEIIPGTEYEEQQKSFRELMFGLWLAIVLVYMVMASRFESLVDPFVVMFSIPLAIIGVVLTLLLTNTIFSLQAFIGCIMLAGIVVNNAIILVDYTNLLRRRDGMPLGEAIEEAGRRRLRPILMTTLTTVVGLMPLALGLGEGGEVQAPMARVVIGGLTSSTLITLVIIPVVYSLFERGKTPDATN